jgi:ubiquinone/menaquinone biosynthesis C-methylase UbiE
MPRARALGRSWNGRASSWHHQVETSPVFHRIRAEVIAAARPARADHFVDLGAGTGFLSLALAGSVGQVLAVDLAEEMLGALAAHAEADGRTNVSTSIANLANFDLPVESVDAVVSSYALHHLTDDEKRALLRRARRWLRPGGRIVIADMMFGRGRTRHDRRVILDKVRQLLAKGPGGVWRIVKNLVRFGLRRGTELPATPEFWTAALEDAGFVEVAYTPIVSEAGLVLGRVQQPR